MEIFEYYKEKIVNGEMEYGEKLPTEYEIVEQFSVSRHTVRQSIIELEKQGYIYREKSKGAFVNKLDKDIKNKSKLIVVITTYLSVYIFPFLIKGIEDVLSKNGYDILLLATHNDKEKEREQFKKLFDYNVDGVIIEPTTSASENTNRDYYKELHKNKIPYVMINACYDKEIQSYVSMDDEKGGYISCKYLIDSGHKRIAGLFKEDDIQGVERKKGYLRALEENNIQIDSTIIGRFKTFEEDFYVDGFTRSILSKDNRPTAIFCYNDKIAMKVIKVTKELGLNIPNDLSIVGYDNDDNVTNTLGSGITTVSHPKEELGKKAAEILLSLIKKEKAQMNYVFEPQIIERESVKKI
ncbi:MAG: GntR family transcriptional regulator [Clostridia bacterium]|nr:GntR family transcriptional regulator [Clostridia bacterium]